MSALGDWLALWFRLPRVRVGEAMSETLRGGSRDRHLYGKPRIRARRS